MTPEQNLYVDLLVARAKVEMERAVLKYPQPNYVALKIAEEAGEVVRGLIHYREGRMDWQEVEKEILQLFAMVFRVVLEGDHVNGIFPPDISASGHAKLGDLEA